MPNPNVSEIIADFLKENGYGGLYLNAECACSLENLMPCCNPSPDCEAGYAYECKGCGYQPECESGHDYDFVIGSCKGFCPIKEFEDDRG